MPWLIDELGHAGMLRLDPADDEAALAKWFTGASIDPAAGYAAADYAQHVRDDFSTYRPLMEMLLAMTGFELIAVEFAGSVYGTCTCRRQPP